MTAFFEKTRSDKTIFNVSDIEQTIPIKMSYQTCFSDWYLRRYCQSSFPMTEINQPGCAASQPKYAIASSASNIGAMIKIISPADTSHSYVPAELFNFWKKCVPPSLRPIIDFSRAKIIKKLQWCTTHPIFRWNQWFNSQMKANQ